MQITKIDTFNVVTQGAEAILTDKSRPIEYDNRRRQRSDASAYVGAAIRPGEWDVLVKLPTSAARDALIATLDTDLSRERRLEATINGVTVEGYAALRRITLPYLASSAELTFEPTFPTWRAITPQTTSATLTANGSITAAVAGNTRTAPLIRIKPTVQRATQTAAVGWKRRTRYRVTNNSDETWYRLPVRIALGDTAAVVTAGRALASGNDVRVWLQGREVARTLVDWNTIASHVWVIVPVLRPGATMDFDVMWHNAAAGTPPVLAYPDLPPFLAVSTNALWRYWYAAGGGAWHLSSATVAPIVDQDVPGAWRSLMTLPNPDNVDDVAQARYTLVSANYHALFDATRGVSGGLQLGDEGLADGIAISHPCGISSISAMFSYQNDRIGVAGTAVIGKLVILVRQTGAQGWEKLFTHQAEATTTPVNIARATYTPAAAVKHLAMAVWPLNEIEVAEATLINRKIHVLWNGYCDVNIDSSKIAIATVQAETEVYEVAAELSLDPTDGYTTTNRLRLGNAGSTGSLDMPRLAVELNQVVVLDGDARTAEVWNTALSTKLETIPNFAVRAVRVAPVLGVATTFVTSEWLPMRATPAGAPMTMSETAMGTLAVDVLTYGEWIP